MYLTNVYTRIEERPSRRHWAFPASRGSSLPCPSLPNSPAGKAHPTPGFGGSLATACAPRARLLPSVCGLAWAWGGGCQAAKKVLGLGTPRSSQGGPWAPAEAQLRTRSQAWSSLTSRAPHSPGGRGGANGRNAVRAGRRPGLAAAA